MKFTPLTKIVACGLFTTMLACGDIPNNRNRRPIHGTDVEGYFPSSSPGDLDGESPSQDDFLPEGNDETEATDLDSRPRQENSDQPQSCAVWQECAEPYGDLNSGMECVANACVCDPSNQWSNTCTQGGGYWSAQLCMCYFASSPPPSTSDSSNDDGRCDWSWEPLCGTDQWVDTSYWDQDCYYDSDNDWVCEDVWVEDGHWQNDGCGDGHWKWICR